MPGYKFTILFQAATLSSDAGNAPKRLGGWSESYYTQQSLGGRMEALMDSLCAKRTRLLGKGFRIVGQRFQRVDPVGLATAFEWNYVNSSGTEGALPQKSLEWTVHSGDGLNKRNISIRGVPDSRVVTGEYTGTTAYNSALMAFFNDLKLNWRFRAIDRNVPLKRLVSINSEGTATWSEPHGLNEGDQFNLYRCYNSSGKLVSGVRQVVQRTSDTTASVMRINGTEALTVTKGQTRKIVIIYPDITIGDHEILTPDAVVRKVGRPFEQFRGRR